MMIALNIEMRVGFLIYVSLAAPMYVCVSTYSSVGLQPDQIIGLHYMVTALLFYYIQEKREYHTLNRGRKEEGLYV